MVQNGLDATASLWPEVETAHAWVQRAALLLENCPAREPLLLRRDYRQLLAQIAQARQGRSVFLSAAATQFVKVSVSYWCGLFCCYEQADLPRTNNASEQGFGSFRYHERRATGRKVTTATTVLRGPVRLVAATVRVERPFTGEELRPKSLVAWRALRCQLEQQQETRRQQRRFRRDPDAFLAAIEGRLLMATLPT
jgi:hypothetical protein